VRILLGLDWPNGGARALLTYLTVTIDEETIVIHNDPFRAIFCGRKQQKWSVMDQGVVVENEEDGKAADRVKQRGGKKTYQMVSPIAIDWVVDTKR
jgi:hypothetical protein